MFDFLKWREWLEARGVELRLNGFETRFSRSPDTRSKLSMGLGIEGSKAMALFENWSTGETDYTIHLKVKQSPMVYEWGLMVDDQTFEPLFQKFIAEFRLHDSGSP